MEAHLLWHWDSKTKKPRHRDSRTKKPHHRDSKAFFQRTKSNDIEIPRLKNRDIKIPRPKSHDIEFLQNSDPYPLCRRLPMFYKIGVPEIFAKFTEISVLESFFDKAAVLQDCSFVKKRHQHMYFCVYIAKFLRTPYLQNTSGWTEHYRTLFLLIPPFHTRFDPLITLLSFAPWFFSFIYSCKYSS